MPLSEALSVDTPQILDDGEWQVAFDRSGGVTTVEVECDQGAVSCRVNEGQAFRVKAGQLKMRRYGRNGINKLEFKRQEDTTSVLWAVAAINA